MADEELKGRIIKLEVELLEAQRNVKVRDIELTAKAKQLSDNERDTAALRVVQQQQSGQVEILRKEIATLSGDNQKLAQRVAELGADRVRPTPTQLIQSFRTAMTDLQSSLASKPGERVGYTVSQFDVDLKALISVDKTDQSVRFMLPEVGESLSADKLSTVRFTFQSVPKAEIPDASLVEVPTVAGTSIDTATVVLKSKGLGVGNIQLQDSSYPVGMVLTQAPDGGDLVPLGGIVALVVARKATVTVPKLEGLVRDAAEKALQDVGLQVGVVTEKAALGPIGMVLSQSMQPGVDVARNSAVDFVVSTRRISAVPNLVEQPLDKAVKLLERAGFVLGTVLNKKHATLDNVVLSQTPGEGTEVAVGGAVDVVVAVVRNLDDVIKEMSAHRDFGKTGLKADELSQRLTESDVKSLPDLSRLSTLSEAQLRTKLNIRSLVAAQIFKKVLQSVLE